MDSRSSSARKSLKRKFEEDFSESKVDLCLSSQLPLHNRSNHQDLLMEGINSHINLLKRCYSWSESDRFDSKRATHFLSGLAKNGWFYVLLLLIWNYNSISDDLI